MSAIVSQLQARTASAQPAKQVCYALAQVGRTMLRVQEKRALGEEICRVAVEQAGFGIAWIGLVGEDHWVRSLAVRGLQGFDLDPIALRLDVHPSPASGAAALRAGRVYVVNDCVDDATAKAWLDPVAFAGARSFAVFPLELQGKSSGILALYSMQVGFFSEEMLDLLGNFALSASSALEYAQRESQRNAAEQALKESELRFRSLAQLSADWYWEQNEHFCFSFLSSETELKSGFRGGASLGITRWDHPGVDLASADWAAHKALHLARQPYRDFTYRRVGADGQPRWLSVSGEPRFDADGRFRGYRGVGKDVTQRVLNEQRVLCLNALYGALSATNEAIVRAQDRNELFREVCRSLVEQGGLSKAWVIALDEGGGCGELLAAYSPRSDSPRAATEKPPPAMSSRLIAAIADGKVQVSSDTSADSNDAVRSDLPSGGFRSMATVPLFEAGCVRFALNMSSHDGGFFDRQMVALLTRMGNDLSFALENLAHERQRRCATEALSQRNEELREINRQLQAAQTQLLQSEKMASIGQLAAGVAHEINNPIGFVHSNLRALETYLRDIFALLTAYEALEPASGRVAADAVRRLKEQMEFSFLRTDIFELVRESRDGIARVKKIVQDLRDFSHGGRSEEWQWAQLHDGINSTLNIVNNEIKYKAQVVKVYGDVPEIECLPSQINQVILNLLVNAAHAIEQPGTITIRTGHAGEEVWFEVADTGSGIPADRLKRIFDPFFTTKPVGKGTGLGLSLSYSIVQKHHGRIEVESEPGKGTAFRVWLPVRQAAPVQETATDE